MLRGGAAAAEPKFTLASPSLQQSQGADPAAAAWQQPRQTYWSGGKVLLWSGMLLLR